MALTGALALLLLLLPLPPGPAPPQDGREAKARARLERAEERARKGEYQAADQAYRNLARRYPDTEAGRIARRRADANGFLGWSWLLQGGPSRNRLDLVLFGDGFLLKKQESFDRKVEIVPRLLERQELFGEYLEWVNLIRANVKSADDKVGGYGREADTAFRGRASGLSGGQVTVDHTRVRAMLDELPEHDGVALVLVKAGSHGTGGGGIAILGERIEPELLFHELGHALAGLADEYSDDVGYRGSPREAPNLAITDDPARVPWRHFLEAGVRGVGIHRGGGGRARGTWKPTVRGCAMAGGEPEYCPVCREAMLLAIYTWVDPVDEVRPEPGAILFLEADGVLELAVRVLQPRRHALEVRWWVLPEEEAQPPPPRRRAFPPGDRRRRGPLPPLPGEPEATTRARAGGWHRFRLRGRDLAPGRWRVLCRVRDDTRLPGERWPWVLRDPYGLLESERSWRLERQP